jgi:hypothetical protein
VEWRQREATERSEALVTPYVVGALFAVFLTEVVFLARWSKLYYTTGLVVYRAGFPVAIPPTSPISAEHLAERFQGGQRPSFEFCEVAWNVVAFREASLFFSYKPVMHGLLRYDPQSRFLTVEGRAQWSVFCVVALPVALVWNAPEALILVALFLAVWLGIYAVQATRFKEVAAYPAGVRTEPESLASLGRRVLRLLALGTLAIVGLKYWLAE